MTKAEAARAAVLAAAEEGLAEDEIAERVGISEARVLRILDTVEAEPKREVEPSDRGKKAPRQFPYKSFIPVERTLLPKEQRLPVKVAECGTESGHTRHYRLKEPYCADCKEAMRLRNEERRHAKLLTFSTEEEAFLYLDGAPKQLRLVRCEKQCRDWHVMTWNGYKLTESQRKLNRRVANRRYRARQKRLDTLQMTSVG